MTAPIDATRCDARTGHCHLCGDEAVVGRVIGVNLPARTGIVAFSDGNATVALDLVDVGVGDDVLVHLGFAIERVGPA